MDRLALRYDQRLDEQRLVAALAQLTALDPGADEVWVFGSRAGEGYLEASDWDLVVVSEKFAGTPFLRRGASVAWQLAEAGFGAVDLVCLTPGELAQRRRQGSAFAAALASAKRLYPPLV